MSEILLDAEALRKKLGLIEKRLAATAQERITVARQIESIEAGCTHKWGSTYLLPKTRDNYARKCEVCGRVEKAKDVKVIFDK